MDFEWMLDGFWCILDGHCWFLERLWWSFWSVTGLWVPAVFPQLYVYIYIYMVTPPTTRQSAFLLVFTVWNADFWCSNFVFFICVHECRSKKIKKNPEKTKKTKRTQSSRGFGAEKVDTKNTSRKPKEPKKQYSRGLGAEKVENQKNLEKTKKNQKKQKNQYSGTLC